MLSGSEFKDFSYLLTCFSSLVPLLICFQFEEGGKVCGLIAHINLVVVILQLMQQGDSILFSLAPEWTEH